jgi:hypothetical protein
VHTVMVMAGGFVLLALGLFIGRSMGGAAGMASAAIYFIPVWLVATLFNMWFGVSRAGYSVADELPIFAALFAVPTAAALYLWWKFSHG